MNREEVLEIVNLAYENNERADLRWANLSGTDLRWANLRWADLRWANLRWANLRWADLRGANLSGTDLREADLSGANGMFAIGQFGKHLVTACGGYISIGCERHTYDEWIEFGEEIARNNGYTEGEIMRYKTWIIMVIDWLRSEEEQDETV